MIKASAGASSKAATKPYCNPRLQKRPVALGGRAPEDAALGEDFATGLEAGFDADFEAVLRSGLEEVPALPGSPELRAAIGLIGGLGLRFASLGGRAFL